MNLAYLLKLAIVGILLNFIVVLSTDAQTNVTTEPMEGVEVQATHAIKLGKTPPLKELIRKPSLTKEKRNKLFKLKRKLPDNFKGRRGYSNVKHPELEHQGPDPLRQTKIEPRNFGPDEPLLNIDGLQNNSSPHDPTGDVGADHYLQAINATVIGVFDKEGDLLDTFTGNTLWSSLGFSSAGDPIIMYDQEANRWIITEFPLGNQLLVAISEDEDPMGSWTAYNFSTPQFPDYPKYGIWPEAYTVTTNEGGGGQVELYVINREQMLDEEDEVDIQRVTVSGSWSSVAGFLAATPVDWSGSEEPLNNEGPYFIRQHDSAWGGSSADEIRIYEMDIDWNDPDDTEVTTTNVETSPFDGYPCSDFSGNGNFPCVPQPGNGGGLDAIPEIIMHQAHYRNFDEHQSMVMSFITDVTNGQNLSGIRWVELRKEGVNEWELYQEGTFSLDDGLDRYMSSIAMDGEGNIALAYNVSSEEEFVGIRYTGRYVDDPLGEMTIPEVIVAEGENSIFSASRLGDYAHMTIDPTNDRVFWHTSEYADGFGSGTRIVAFQLRDEFDMAATQVLFPETGSDFENDEYITMEVKNAGIEEVTEFAVKFKLNNDPTYTQNVDLDTPLATGETYVHTFNGSVDLSDLGDYELEVCVDLDDDENEENDCTTIFFANIVDHDASVVDIQGLSNITCDGNMDVTLTLENNGSANMSSAQIAIYLNDNFSQLIEWTGDLEYNETDEIDVTINNVLNGENTIVAQTLLPNDLPDGLEDNNEYEVDFNAIVGGTTVTIEFTTDNDAEESSWEIENEDGDVIYFGEGYTGNYDLFEEEVCLLPDGCYTLTIFDTAGDGLYDPPGSNEPSLIIVDSDGNELGVLNDLTFGASEDIDFCVNDGCLLSAEAVASGESAPGESDGVIMVDINNGNGPFDISIDGGDNFQSGTIFEDLEPGEYEVLVQDDDDCTFETTVVVGECNIEVMAESMGTSSSNSSDAQVIVTSTGNTSPLQYSIDGGNTFQDSNLFDGLPVGEYEILVQDVYGCQATAEGIMVSVGAEDIKTFGSIIEVFPNPTNGLVQINIKGLGKKAEHQIKYNVFNAQGQLIHQGVLGKYDDTYTGPLSLVAYPAQVYYIKFEDKDVTKLLRVVKQ